jgi:hypothetical protein
MGLVEGQLGMEFENLSLEGKASVEIIERTWGDNPMTDTVVWISPSSAAYELH